MALYGPNPSRKIWHFLMQCAVERTMDMAAKNQIWSSLCPSINYFVAAIQQIFLVFRVRDIQRLMGDDNPQLLPGRLPKSVNDPVHLRFGYVAVYVAITACGSNADNKRIDWFIGRFELFPNTLLYRAYGANRLAARLSKGVS
jgi:hypothetical protein